MMEGTGLLLLSAVGGYWTLERATHHKGRLKQVGRLVGSLVIIVSLIGVGCRMWHLTTGKSGYHKMSKMGHHDYRPHHPSRAPSSPSPAQ